MTLRELRKSMGVGQRTLGARLGWSQARISQYEANGVGRIAALRDFLEGLGLELKLVAVGEDEEVEVHTGPRSTDEVSLE